MVRLSNGFVGFFGKNVIFYDFPVRMLSNL
jgi:hypothetical protein